MSDHADLRKTIDQVASRFGAVWPLHSFVTANPLSGYEHLPFREAVRQGERLYGGSGYPSSKTFQYAWEQGHIDPTILRKYLAPSDYPSDPGDALKALDSEQRRRVDGRDWSPEDRSTDRVVAKYLSVFLDQGRTHWSMPGRDSGFYRAVERLVPHDSEVPNRDSVADWPDRPAHAVRSALSDVDRSAWDAAIERQLASLPGWTGFIKYRTDQSSEWQSDYPITMLDYLAVRFQIAIHFDAPIDQSERDQRATPDGFDVADMGSGPDRSLHEIWLNALEETYRRRLVDALEDNSTEPPPTDEARPDAQLVFCIDTRSEIIRRHIEARGNYQTHGYAGFFGIPMTYSEYLSDAESASCPPIVDAEHHIEEFPDSDLDDEGQALEQRLAHEEAGQDLLAALQSNPATAFSFVESAGLGYGFSLAARTLIPGKVSEWLSSIDDLMPSIGDVCSPTLEPDDTRASERTIGIPFDQRVEYAAAAFELMGWQQFGRLVVFVGHTASTSNNPFDSSLDCGACAGNPGGASARTLATICRDPKIQQALRSRGIDLPEDTVFVAGEHNTTTDEITLFDRHVPESHRDDLQSLRQDLDIARTESAEERVESLGTNTDDPTFEAERRSADWAQTRPEWGLAGNACFIIGPREWTSHLDLAGRAFLHSYDWRVDAQGDALEAIMTGPMVVTQWINNQYYFATVDNPVYGSGSKTTQNPIGNVGVFQGNGGDLMCGLPLESVKSDDQRAYHQPIRLSTVIEAPVDRVEQILMQHDHLVTLLDHEWLSLTVVDPTQGRKQFDYNGELTWSAGQTDHAQTQSTAPQAS